MIIGAGGQAWEACNHGGNEEEEQMQQRRGDWPRRAARVMVSAAWSSSTWSRMPAMASPSTAFLVLWVAGLTR